MATKEIKPKTYKRTNLPFNSKGESDFGISVTVPDMSKPIRELLVRHANGIADSVQYDGIYSGDLPDYRGMEPHELDKLMYDTQMQVKDLEKQKEVNAINLYNAQNKSRMEQQKALIDKATKDALNKKENGV